MKLLRITLTLLITSLVAVACGNDEPDVQRPSVLRTITAETPFVVVDEGATAEIVFDVEEPRALFNYIVSTIGCQVELRLADKPTAKPEYITLERVREGEKPGRYIATIADKGNGATYIERVMIVIKKESGELVRSNTITVQSANFVGGISEIRLEKSKNTALKKDVVFRYDNNTRTYSAHIDEYHAERKFVATISYEGIDRITLNGTDYAKGEAVDFKSDVELVTSLGDNSTNYTLHLSCFTGLPVVRIETPGRQGVWSKEYWVNGSTLWLDGMGKFKDMDATEMAIRGRGNSTWGYDKKPYAIKFTEKQKVMGMPKHKRWVLLANYMDRTLLRNRVAYELARQTSLEWTPGCEFVELFLNGEHLGQYLLAEQVRVDNDRINITEMTPNDNTGNAITGGYLLELDFHFDNMWQWHTNKGVPFSVKFPDEEDLTEPQLKWIKNHIAEAEDTIYGNNFRDKTNGYHKYIDPQSFIDYWLIYEICVNHEIANPGSVFLSKDRGGKIVAGPVWDFDWGTFSYNASPQAQWGLFMTHAWWYGRLFEDDAFWALAKERWGVLKPKFEQIFEFIDEEREYISRSWDVNFKMWSISTNINGDEWLPKDEAIDRLVDITRDRIEIIDNALR